MVQIALLICGVLALLKGRLTVTRSRVLEAVPARAIGLGFIGVAGLPFIVGSDTGLWAMLGGGAILTVVAFSLSTKNPLADEIPMK